MPRHGKHRSSVGTPAARATTVVKRCQALSWPLAVPQRKTGWPMRAAARLRTLMRWWLSTRSWAWYQARQSECGSSSGKCSGVRDALLIQSA
jgi:hypothetical protein